MIVNKTASIIIYMNTAECNFLCNSHNFDILPRPKPRTTVNVCLASDFQGGEPGIVV